MLFVIPSGVKRSRGISYLPKFAGIDPATAVGMTKAFYRNHYC